MKAHSIHDPHMHNGPFQILILFLKSSKHVTDLTLGGSLFQIFKMISNHTKLANRIQTPLPGAIKFSLTVMIAVGVWLA